MEIKFYAKLQIGQFTLPCENQCNSEIFWFGPIANDV
jgi:hypothetical protein